MVLATKENNSEKMGNRSAQLFNHDSANIKPNEEPYVASLQPNHIPNELSESNFSELWDMPRNFIEPVNVRRGGWSGTSVVETYTEAGSQTLYVKRQENQRRYSLRYPFGALTYKFEVDALLALMPAEMPVVELVSFGFRRVAKKQQGILVTRAVPYLPLSDLNNAEVNWPLILPALERAGMQLYNFHQTRWQHGSLYPQHLFIDTELGDLRLIDFECARKCSSVNTAIERDLRQLIRRIDWIPDFAVQSLLKPYLQSYPDVLEKLGRIF